MNWRKGLVRFWLVFSLLWAALAVWYAYADWWVPRQAAFRATAAREACVAAAKENPALCYSGARSFADLIPVWPTIRGYVVLAVLPPAVLLMFGMLGFWIAAGFRSR